jgi:hypothetical protein
MCANSHSIAASAVEFDTARACTIRMHVSHTHTHTHTHTTSADIQQTTVTHSALSGVLREAHGGDGGDDGGVGLGGCGGSSGATATALGQQLLARRQSRAAATARNRASHTDRAGESGVNGRNVLCSERVSERVTGDDECVCVRE